MSRPSTEAQYLASLLPPSVTATGIGRRSFAQRGAGRGRGSLVRLQGFWAPVDRVGQPRAVAAGPQPPPSGTLTFGSNQSDVVPKQAYAQLVTGFNDPNIKVTINTVDHNAFQENINTYLQGSPDDVFTWFAGYRMQFFAAQGLVAPIDDVWAGIDDQFATGTRPRRPAPTARSTSSRSTTTRGRSSTGRASSPTRATRCRRRWDGLHGAGREDEDGRPDPDRLRRQGRLARDGHLRLPEHADQRLPVPHRPDGAQGVLDRRQGQEGLRHLEVRPVPAATGPTRSA